MLEVNPQLRIPLREIRFTFSRSSGPGGQNVNKVNTKATLRWPIMSSPSLSEEVRARLVKALGRRVTAGGDLLVTSQRFRDAGRNVADCLEKLADLLAPFARRVKARKPSRPGRSAVQRRLRHKKQRSERKQRRRTRPDDGGI